VKRRMTHYEGNPNPDCRLDFGDRGERILVVFNNRNKCAVCGEKDWRKWYYCEQDRVIYCRKCIKKHHSRQPHIDYKIDAVRTEKHNPHHILNEALIDDA